MIKIEHVEKLDKTLENLIDDEFNKYAAQNDVNCNYTTFNFVAKENGEFAGALTGYTIYSEVHIDRLIVAQKHRGKGIGTKLMKEVENHFKDKKFNNINLATDAFQAPEFYKKCGYNLEFVRENKENPKHTGYYFAKYFNKKTIMHNLKMISNKKLPFLQYIENGKKKAEGRIATELIKSFKVGELLKLESPTEYVICEITYLNFYKSFEEMLNAESLKNMVPFVDNFEQALELYESFPGAERVKELGCCAIGVKHISSELDFLTF